MAHVRTAVVTRSLELHDLEVVVGRRVLAGPLSLVHTPGTILWILGENGAGKSSLLRVLARRAKHRGRLVLSPPPDDLRSIAYYAPVMRFPTGITVADWLTLHRRQQPDDGVEGVAALLPENAHGAVNKLSTGEAKRLQLWALLRTSRPYYFLDEPFEHLSPAGKQSLKHILARHARESVVVIATNQDVPSDVPANVLELA